MAVHFIFMLQWHRVQITPAAAAMDVNRHARVSPPDASTCFEIEHLIQLVRKAMATSFTHPAEHLSEESDLNVI